MNNGLDPTYSAADTTDTIQTFLERQVLIKTYQWQIGTTLFEEFDPWSLFFENKRVINRLINFKLLRAKLHVKFLINGNAFYYGRAIASYTPLHLHDQRTRMRLGVQEDFVEASQRPHIYLDPTTSTGGELVLPYFHPRNALEIPKRQWQEMGLITLADLNPLAITTDNTEPISISVMAFATDVDISVPTSVVPFVFENQSDEYSAGVVSRPATFIASMASALNSFPVIGPFMRATELAASATAGIAQLFGYSKPLAQTLDCYINTGNRFMATSSPSSQAAPLSVDPKKEVTIDPRTVGLDPCDSLAIVPIATRESYITTFGWSQTNTVNDLLWNTHIEPNMFREVTIDSANEVHMTPSCLTTSVFEFWRGSMEFRFQIVASKYHKGRLRFVWDPEYQSTSEYNVNYQQIVDISDCTDHVFKVGWGASTLYLPCEHMATNQIPFSTLPLTQARGNGTLSVFVLNDLTAPTDVLAPIEINVFPRMCDDFELICPTNKPLQFMDLLPPVPSKLPNAVRAVPALTSRNPSVNVIAGRNYPVTSGYMEFEPAFAGSCAFDMPFNIQTDYDGTVELGIDFKVDYTAPLAGQAVVVVDGTSYFSVINPGSNDVKIRHVYNFSAGDPTKLSIPISINVAGFTPGSDTLTIERFYIPMARDTEYQLIPATSYLWTLSGGAVIGSYLGSDTIALDNIADNATAGLITPNEDVTLCVIGVPDGGVLQYNAVGTITMTAAAGWFATDSSVSANFQNINLTASVAPVEFAYVWAASRVFDNESGEMQMESPGVAPIAGPPDEVMGSTNFAAMANSICAGEVIRSFRPLLKRFVLRQTSATSIPVPSLTSLVPKDGSANESTNLTLLKMLMASFVGYRGSMRFMPIADDVAKGTVIRATQGWQSAATYDSTILDNVRLGEAGIFMYRTVGNYPEFEIPWYCPYRFQFSRRTDVFDYHQYAIEEPKFFSATDGVNNQLLTSIGEDFNLYFFLSTPIVTRK